MYLAKYFWSHLNSLNLTFQLLLCKSKVNKRNDERFSNRIYSLFFLMVILLKHLWLIPNKLKWQDCNIFTKLVPLQTPSRSSHRSCSVKKDAHKNLWNFTVKHLCWSLFLINLQTFRSAKVYMNIYFEEHLQTTASDKTLSQCLPLTFVEISFSV